LAPVAGMDGVAWVEGRAGLPTTIGDGVFAFADGFTVVFGEGTGFATGVGTAVGEFVKPGGLGATTLFVLGDTVDCLRGDGARRFDLGDATLVTRDDGTGAAITAGVEGTVLATLDDGTGDVAVAGGDAAVAGVAGEDPEGTEFVALDDGRRVDVTVAGEDTADGTELVKLDDGTVVDAAVAGEDNEPFGEEFGATLCTFGEGTVTPFALGDATPFPTLGLITGFTVEGETTFGGLGTF